VSLTAQLVGGPGDGRELEVDAIIDVVYQYADGHAVAYWLRRPDEPITAETRLMYDFDPTYGYL
jgi:hypothetical protein